jgi:predicted ABC-type ATPase
MSQPTMFMIAGPNGAGKSTLYETRIRALVPQVPFINADMIQRDELQQTSMDASYMAAQIAEQRRQKHLIDRASFVSESTFSHRSKLSLVDDAQKAGFRVVMYHVHLHSPDLSVKRVAHRHSQGGHDVPEHKIRERYARNPALIREAVLQADRAFIYDNSTFGHPPHLAIEMRCGRVIFASDRVPAWACETYAKELERFLRA